MQRANRMAFAFGGSLLLALASGCGDDGDGGGSDGGLAGQLSTAGTSAGGGSGGRGGASGAAAGGTSGASGASAGAGAGGTRVVTGLPASRPLDELSSQEAQALCESLANSARDAFPDEALARFTCTLAALPLSASQTPDGMLTIDRMACEQSVSACLELEGTSSFENNCDDADVAAELSQCDATAGELEACLNEAIGQLRQLLASVTCSASLSDAGPGFEEPAACAALEARCPGVLDAVGDGTDVLPSDDDLGAGTGGTGGMPVGPGGCSETCTDSGDGFCDDGGEGADTDWCAFGTDCADCGARP